MPTTYEKCGEEVTDLLKRVVNKYHDELKKAKVTIDCLFARNPDGDALKLHGYKCAAVVRKVGLKDRAKGMADAEIVIDEKGWEEMMEAQKIALLDHELYHLVPKKDENGHFDYDDLNRPKLKIKLHDAQIGIFKTIIERHGEDSIDAKVAEQFIDEFSQLLLWRKDPHMVG